MGLHAQRVEHDGVGRVPQQLLAVDAARRHLRLALHVPLPARRLLRVRRRPSQLGRHGAEPRVRPTLADTKTPPTPDPGRDRTKSDSTISLPRSVLSPLTCPCVCTCRLYGVPRFQNCSNCAGLRQFPLIDANYPGGGAAMRKMFASNASRAHFIDGAMAKLKQHKYDGCERNDMPIPLLRSESVSAGARVCL